MIKDDPPCGCDAYTHTRPFIVPQQEPESLQSHHQLGSQIQIPVT